MLDVNQAIQALSVFDPNLKPTGLAQCYKGDYIFEVAPADYDSDRDGLIDDGLLVVDGNTGSVKEFNPINDKDYNLDTIEFLDIQEGI